MFLQTLDYRLSLVFATFLLGPTYLTKLMLCVMLLSTGLLNLCIIPFLSLNESSFGFWLWWNLTTWSFSPAIKSSENKMWTFLGKLNGELSHAADCIILYLHSMIYGWTSNCALLSWCHIYWDCANETNFQVVSYKH